MIAARVIQGIGGGVVPLAFGIVRDELPREKVPGAVGVIAALTAVGAGLGIVLAGPIVAILGYHWLFWLPLIMVGVATLAAQIFVPESPVRSPGKISWGAAALLSAWLVALLVAVSQAPLWGWASGRVLGLIGSSVVLAAGWLLVEVRSEYPLIDMQMMRIPAVWTTNLVALLFGVGIYATFALLPGIPPDPVERGVRGFGASITESGLHHLLPLTVAMFALGVVSGRMGRRFGSKAVLVAGSTISIVPFVILTTAHSEKWAILLAMAVLGTGFGLAFSAMSNLIVAAVPAHQTGVASGMNANIRTIGGSIGAAVMASIVTAGVRSGGLPRASGYVHGFEVPGVATAAAALAGLLVPAGARRRTSSATETDDVARVEPVLVTGGILAGDPSD